MTKEEQMKLKPKYWLAICKKKVDDYEVGSVYKAEETFYNDPPSDWKCHLPIEQRGLEEFYDCYKIYLPHSSRNFTKSVINQFFELKEYKNFCGIVKYDSNTCKKLIETIYRPIQKSACGISNFLFFKNLIVQECEMNKKETEKFCIDCGDDQELFLQLTKDNLLTIKL